MAEGFAWVVLPTWKGRYPLRYLLAVAATMVAVGLVPALITDDFGWTSTARWVLFGVWVGAAAAVFVQGRRELIVAAGTFHGHPGLEGLTSNQVLGIEVRRRWWSRRVRVQPVGRRPVPLPIVSWRIWPDPHFEDQVRDLRLALGMPADPPPDLG